MSSKSERALSKKGKLQKMDHAHQKVFDYFDIFSLYNTLSWFSSSVNL